MVGFAADLSVHGDRVALVTEDEEVTYAGLAARADAVAEQLGPDRRLVLIRGENRLHIVVAYLGALRGGHVPLLVPGQKADLGRIRETFDPDVVVGDDGDGHLAVEVRRAAAHELHPSLALLLTTSGSTGEPRAVRLSHENLESNAEAIATYLAIDPEDCAATSLPLHYCYGLSVLHSHLLRGARVALTDLSVVDRCFWDRFRTHGCTSFAGVPYTFDLLDRVGFDRMELPTLRYVTQAGGRLPADTVRRYAALGARDGWDLVVMYGQTEATARMAYLPPHLAAARPDSIGQPIPGGSFEVDDGELVYRGPNVMLGYATGPGDLALGRTISELRTGDLARRVPDGLYEIVGRLHRFAKIAGLRIELDDVEDALRRSGHTTLCASDDQRLVVGLVATETTAGAVATEAAALCGLPANRIAVVTFDELPRLANGKPDVQRLLDAARDALGAGVTYEDALDDDEVHPAIRALFVDVLRVPAVAADDSFASLGGDSLSYVEAAIGLEELIGDLPPDWHTIPARALVPVGGHRRSTVRLDTTIVCRALAIVFVVAGHTTSLDVHGGALVLFGIAGWNFARFGQRTANRLRSIARIAIPSMIWLAFAAFVLDRGLGLRNVLLFDAWVDGRTPRSGYWFVELLVQLLLALTLLLALPPVARLVRRHPFAVPCALAVVGLAVHLDVVPEGLGKPHDLLPQEVLWLFAVGWAAAAARTTPARLVVTGLLCAGLSEGPFTTIDVRVGIGLAAVIWLPTVPVPRPLVRPLAQVAAASLAIYLTHWEVVPPVRRAAGGGSALVAALLVGVAAWWVVSQVADAIAARGRSTRPEGDRQLL